MRIPAAGLTLMVSICLIGVLGNGGSLRAEPMAVVDVEKAPDALTVVSKEPEETDRPEHESIDTKGRGLEGDLWERLVRKRLLPMPRSTRVEVASIDSGDQTTEPSLISATNVRLDEDGLWEAEFREVVRPLYDELAISGVIDAVSGVKSYLDLSMSSSVAEPSTSDTRYGASPEYAPWENDPNNHQRSAAQIEKDKILTSIMIEELIASIKPWLLTLIGAYALWYLFKLGLDYSRWRSARALRRSSKRTHGRSRRDK